VEEDATVPLEVREGVFESRCIGGQFVRERLDVERAVRVVQHPHDVVPELRRRVPQHPQRE
jgi:protein subunit release factor A